MPGRGTIIARYHRAAMAAQVTVREIFPDPSMIVRERAAAKSVCRAVEKAEHLLDDLELELHYLAANHIAEIMLPEFPVAPEVVYQEFEPEQPPERQ